MKSTINNLFNEKIFIMKTKLIFIIIALLSIVNTALSFEIRLTKQSEIDQLVNFTSFTTDVLITTNPGQTTDLITNLDGLMNIDSFPGTLTIDSVFITTLAPVEGLSSEGLYLYNNPYLEDISAIGTMSVEYGVAFGNNDAIKNINSDHLPEFRGVIEDQPIFPIYDNDALEHVNIKVPSNLNLSIPIEGNKNLKTINLEGNLTSCGFHNNESLEYLYYQTTRASMGNIEITGNTSLTTVKGFSNIERSGVYRIYNNPLLENMCFLQQILNKTFTVIIEEIYNNGAGANSIDEIMAQDCSNWLSIREARLESLSVFPNPTHDILNIEDLQESTPYRLINLQGQLVQQGMAQPKQPLHLEQLPSGIYFLELEGEKPIKVVKQ
jgi:hypothetical protein